MGRASNPIVRFLVLRGLLRPLGGVDPMGRSGNCRIANARTSLRGIFVLGMETERIGRPRLTLISEKERVRGGSERCFMMLLCDQTAPSSGSEEQ